MKSVEAGFCEFHGWFTAGINLPMARGAVGFRDVRDVWQKPNQKLFGQSMIPKRFADKNFEAYEATEKGQYQALKSCMDFAQELKADWFSGKTLLLIGTPGTGKTHLACAVGHETIKQGRTVLYTTVTRLLEDIKSSWNDKERSVKNIIARYVSVDLLIMDEIGAFRGISEREKDYLFEVINARYEQMKPMIAVSNLRLSGADSIEAYLEERSLTGYVNRPV